MTLFVAGAAILSILLTIQAAYTLYITIYTWDRPDAHLKARAPNVFRMPQKSFTVLLPARHEEDVIQDTIERVVRTRYPQHMVEAFVICESGDTGTIARAQDKLVELRATGINNVRLLVFDDKPINKPHGLNFGLRASKNEVITIFDAEDEIHPDIFNVVNTVMLEEDVRVVQCGVQLMNFNSSWYSTLNVLEYFFWFKSRLHYHAKIGMIPLGGNTVFFSREIMTKLGGWDEHNLTEDADVGIRISAMREKVSVVYDDRYVTKEETPPTLGHFMRQRTRWSQGFFQTLKKGDWRKLPNLKQKALAVYTLGFPAIQALLTLYIPVSVWMMFTTKVAVPVAMLLLMPLYFLLAHYIVSVVGLYEFTDAHGLNPSSTTWLIMLVSYIPYQWILGYSALRAAARELRGVSNWEKTAHVGAHRQAAA